jgi:hypothetical protein
MISNVHRVAICSALAYAATIATAQITITAGSMTSFANGATGRFGSTSGALSDGILNWSGTTGFNEIATSISGGPIPPGEPLNIFPGTTCITESSHYGFINFAGDSAFKMIDSHCESNAALDDMDGPDLSANAGSNGNFEYTFTVTASTPYSLTGVTAIDNEDASGSIRMYRGLIAIHSVFLAGNGPYSFSGTLTPGNYRIFGNSSVYAAAGTGGNGVGVAGDFSESSTITARLILGCIGITVEPDDVTLCPGDSSSTLVEAGGNPAPGYQWQVQDAGAPGGWRDLNEPEALLDGMGNPGVSVAGTQGPSLEVVSEGDATTVVVRCVVTNSCGSATSREVTVSVLSASDPFCGGSSCPPCAADYDQNGGVDGGDLAAFFADFETGEACADVDQNGGVDGGDLGFFFAVFEAGGC